MRTVWVPVASATDVAPGDVVAVAAGRSEWVLWRTRSGRLGLLPRRCPHLDWDLAEAQVVGEELVCPGHGWCFDARGRAGKRTERGRLDRKDDVAVPERRERGGRVEVLVSEPA